MTKNILFLLFFCTSSLNFFAQTDCSGAQAYIVYALSNTKSALEANNITHAKHFAEKAKESFENVQASLESCQCEDINDLVYNAINYLSKAKPAKKIEDAYYYANKGNQLAKAIIEKLDTCTAVTKDAISTVQINKTDEISSISYEQEQLKQQQLVLEQKQAKLKQKLKLKKEQELTLKKEELISKMEFTIQNNINTFNEALSACDCNTKILNPSINSEDLFIQSFEGIRLFFIDTIQGLSSNYMLKLSDCIK